GRRRQTPRCRVAGIPELPDPCSTTGAAWPPVRRTTSPEHSRQRLLRDNSTGLVEHRCSSADRAWQGPTRASQETRLMMAPSAPRAPAPPPRLTAPAPSGTPHPSSRRAPPATPTYCCTNAILTEQQANRVAVRTAVPPDRRGRRQSQTGASARASDLLLAG